MYIQTRVYPRAAGTHRFCPTCPVTQPLHVLTPAMPVWFMHSPANADNSQASHVWRTSQIGRAWPGAMCKEAGAPGTPRRRWLWHSAQGAPASFSVGEWILQAPAGSDQHISNCCSERERRLLLDDVSLLLHTWQCGFCQRKDQSALGFTAVQLGLVCRTRGQRLGSKGHGSAMPGSKWLSKNSARRDARNPL